MLVSEALALLRVDAQGIFLHRDSWMRRLAERFDEGNPLRLPTTAAYYWTDVLGLIAAHDKFQLATVRQDCEILDHGPHRSEGVKITSGKVGVWKDISSIIIALYYWHLALTWLETKLLVLTPEPRAGHAFELSPLFGAVGSSHRYRV